MRATFLVATGGVAAVAWLAACPTETPCQTDTDCGGSRICVNQICVGGHGPASDAAPVADAQIDARILDSSAPTDAGGVDSAVLVDAGMPDQARPDTSTVVDTGPRPDTAIAPDTAAAADTSSPVDAGTAVDAAGAPDSAVAADAAGHDADCAPACGTRVCGDDGCGGSCGPCTAPTPACQNGACAACDDDGDCATGKCEKASGACLERACIYDEHCTVSYYGHCSSTYACVSGHDCVDELAYLPYPWDDTMTVVITGDTSDADSQYAPTAGCDDAAGPEDIYELSLPRQVRKVTLTLQALPGAADWDTVLYVAANVCGSTNLGCADDLTSAQPEVLVLSEPTYSTVTVVVDGYEYNDDGAYRLTMTVDECDGEADCTTAERCLSPSADHSRCVRE